MNNKIMFISSGDTAAQAVTAALHRRGFRVVRTFDLQSAFVTYPGYEAIQEADDCPYHGTNPCSCQFIMLLVYGNAPEPVVITLSGTEAQAQLQIVQDMTKRTDPRLVGQVMTVLMETRSAQTITPPRPEERAVPGE